VKMDEMGSRLKCSPRKSLTRTAQESRFISVLFPKKNLGACTQPSYGCSGTACVTSICSDLLDYRLVARDGRGGSVF
jgi:hypothetical protein